MVFLFGYNASCFGKFSKFYVETSIRKSRVFNDGSKPGNDILPKSLLNQIEIEIHVSHIHFII